VAEGGLAATAPGDYLIGAWAIVMLHDYHRGQGFAAHGGLNQKLDYLYVVNRDNVARYDQAFFQRGDALHFGVYPKARHPRPGRYDFRLAHLVRIELPEGHRGRCYVLRTGCPWVMLPKSLSPVAVGAQELQPLGGTRQVRPAAGAHARAVAATVGASSRIR